MIRMEILRLWIFGGLNLKMKLMSIVQTRWQREWSRNGKLFIYYNYYMRQKPTGFKLF